VIPTAITNFELELGMPHLGRHNLNENALFKALGADRWRHLEELGRCRSAQIANNEGARLYATFFFVEINCPLSHPLSGFEENQSLVFDGDLCHFGKTHLDGRYTLRQNPDVWIRMSNVFIHQKAGPSKLAVDFPSNVDFSRIPSLTKEPETVNMCRLARENGAFLEALPGDVSLFEGTREYTYSLDADRDLNGAGLVYFANFICFLDAAERQILRSHAIPTSFLDKRSTYRRVIGYFGNAEASDSLSIQLRARARDVVNTRGERQVDFGFDYVLSRESDGKVIIVSSARKVAPVQDAEEMRCVAEKTQS